jgi:hypothetical protein
MTPAEADLASLRRVCDRAEERRPARHDALSAVCEAGLDATRARARLDRIRAVCDDLAVMRDEAFAVVAAERAAASPVRLVPRALTATMSFALARAEDRLAEARDCCDAAAEHVAWWMWHRSLGHDGLMSAAADDQIAAWREERDRCADAIASALDARAPFLAARWQEVAS